METGLKCVYECLSICASDSNVDVIYVSPVIVPDEVLQYYRRLLGLSPAIQSGDVTDQTDLSSRFRVITPEAVKPFQVSACVSFLRDQFLDF